jgi:dTDP-4-amino-4,6-dideoxygalactose transaminase
MVPYLDMQAQAKALAPELLEAASAVISSGRYVLGEHVEAFERAFARECGVSDAIAVNTGTSALHLALLGLGIGPGDEVITVAMTFVATVAAIGYTGATPVLVDIDPATGNMDPAALEAAITPRTRAVIPVHLHGRMADMAAILAITRRHGLALIEDAAQAHAAVYQGRPAGSIGEVGCFSFYPGKNLGACGEGGALVTNDPVLARRVRVLRDWGQEEKYVHVVKGFNFRMDAIQGAFLGVKLRYLAGWTKARQDIAAQYDAGLAHVPGLVLPPPGRPGEHVYHVYAVRTSDRSRVAKALANAGISTGMHYPVPVHLQPAWSELGHKRGDFPVAEAWAAETLSLPIYPELSSAQIREVCAALSDAMQTGPATDSTPAREAADVRAA